MPMIEAKYLVLLVVLGSTACLAKNFGSINVDGIGTIYVVGPDWSAGNVNVFGDGFSLNGGGRV